MNKKIMEILSALGSVVLLVALFALVRANIPEYQGYGFVVSLAIFVILTSLIGLKLVSMK